MDVNKILEISLPRADDNNFSIKDYFNSLENPYVNYKLIFPFLIIGIFVSLREWKKWLLLYLLLIHYSLIHVIYFAHERFRTPVVPILILFASFGLYSIVKVGINIFIRLYSKFYLLRHRYDTV